MVRLETELRDKDNTLVYNPKIFDFKLHLLVDGYFV